MKHYLTIKLLKLAAKWCVYGDTYDCIVEAIEIEEYYHKNN